MIQTTSPIRTVPRQTDPAGNQYRLNDGQDEARDLTEFTAIEGTAEKPYRFRAQVAGLKDGSQHGNLDLYVLLDTQGGGRSDLPDGIPGRTDHPWELALGVYDEQTQSLRNAQGQSLAGLKQVRFDRANNSIEFALDKAALRSAGWQEGGPLHAQVFTTKDFGTQITDTVSNQKPWDHSGELKGGLQLAGAPPAPPTPTPEPGPGQPKMYVAVHWHMHQPIYWPGQNIVETANNPNSSDNPIPHVTWPDRTNGYTHYMADAVEKNLNLPHMGVQISWSGSLTEDLNTLAQNGIGYAPNWMDHYRQARRWKTSLGNPRLDFVGFGYHHPLMPLTTTGQAGEDRDMELQVQSHRQMLNETFGGPVSKGFFPPEQAFSERMIPLLKKTGHEWVLVDNFHIERAASGYPWSWREKVQPPNPAEQINPAQPEYAHLTCEQNTLNPVSALGLRPHYAGYIDPNTGKEERIMVVPGERSLGYDDSYGDRSPLPRLAQLEKFNTDPKHPLLIVLDHDGDNFGASGSRYYHETMQWVQQNPDKVEMTTVQDYLDRFPPEQNDLVHVEDGSWNGADLGNQEFGKWLGRPYTPQGKVDYQNGYSPDRNSWAVLVAAENRVATADRLQPATGPAQVASGNGNQTDKAWHYFLQGETSCYEYWDGQNEWDSKPTLAANLAVEQADQVLAGLNQDPLGPTLFTPQRTPYNPGGIDDLHRDTPAPTDFTVWTLGYDVSGMKRVELKWRVDPSGRRDCREDEMYGDPSLWSTQAMEERQLDSKTSLKPQYKANEYSARIEGQSDCLIQYYVEAEDGAGNLTRSPIQHVQVGPRHSD